MAIRLHLLGSVDLRGPDGTRISSVLVQPKRTALLAYMAAATSGFVRRESLLAVFWPDLDDAHARNALSKALHHLRRSLGEEAVVTLGGGEVGISKAHLWCDVAAFHAAIEGGYAARALELCERGTFLEGFAVSDLPEFECWVDGEREALRRRAGEALALGSEEAEAAGDLAGAVGPPDDLRRSLQRGGGPTAPRPPGPNGGPGRSRAGLREVCGAPGGRPRALTRPRDRGPGTGHSRSGRGRGG